MVVPGELEPNSKRFHEAECKVTPLKNQTNDKRSSLAVSETGVAIIGSFFRDVTFTWTYLIPRKAKICLQHLSPRTVNVHTLSIYNETSCKVKTRRNSSFAPPIAVLDVVNTSVGLGLTTIVSGIGRAVAILEKRASERRVSILQKSRSKSAWTGKKK